MLTSLTHCGLCKSLLPFYHNHSTTTATSTTATKLHIFCPTPILTAPSLLYSASICSLRPNGSELERQPQAHTWVQELQCSPIPGVMEGIMEGETMGGMGIRQGGHLTVGGTAGMEAVVEAVMVVGTENILLTVVAAVSGPDHLITHHTVADVATDVYLSSLLSSFKSVLFSYLFCRYCLLLGFLFCFMVESSTKDSSPINSVTSCSRSSFVSDLEKAWCIAYGCSRAAFI